MFWVLTAILVTNTLISLYTNLRQYRKLAGSMPKTASVVCTAEEWPKATSYNRHKLVFASVSNIFDTIKDILFLAYIDTIHAKFLRFFKNPATPLILSFMLAEKILNIPFSAYFDFVIERMFGFNKKTLRVFFTDILIGFALTICIAAPFFYIFFYIILRFPNFELYLGAFITLFNFFILWIYPTFIAPLYNTFTPLESGSLMSKIHDLASKVGFKVDSILVMDGSKRSGHSNAYFTGFGKVKKIVFYNTIIEQLSEDEIVAVLAHELGHWKYCHPVQLVLLSSFEVFGYISLFKTFVKEVNSQTIALKSIKFFFAVSCTLLPITFMMNVVSRFFERQADRFAVSNGYGDLLKKALVKMHAENKSSPVVDSLYSAMNHSHPHTTERLELIDQEMKKRQ